MKNERSTLLSVVIPVHNRPSLIKRTVESVVDQTYRPFELILVDNNSDDETPKVLEALAKVYSDERLKITVLEEKNAGATFARNCGLNAVTTPWTMFFDSDDIMLPTHIENAMAAAENNGDVDIIGWDVANLGLDKKRAILPFEPKDIAYNNLFHGSLSTQRYMARTELFRKVGGWNTKMSIWDDIELGARMLTLKPQILKIKEPVPSVLVEAQERSITGKNYASRIDKYHVALDSIRTTLDESHKDWVELKKVIIGATIVREGVHDGHRLYTDAMQCTTNKWHRFLWRIAYFYTRFGGRGIARILKKLIY
jgi:glycosyltransferase involved in cell wall biosynthesis